VCHAERKAATRSPTPGLRGTPRKTGALPRPAQDSPSSGNTRSAPGAPVGDSRGPVARRPVARRRLATPASQRRARLTPRGSCPSRRPNPLACGSPVPAAPAGAPESAPLRRYRGSAPRSGSRPCPDAPRWPAPRAADAPGAAAGASLPAFPPLRLRLAPLAQTPAGLVLALTVATLPRAGSRWSPLLPVSRSAPCRRSADTPLALAGSPVYHTPAPLSGVRLRAHPVGAYHPPPAAVVAAHLPAPVPVFAPATPESRVCLPPPPPPGGGGAGGAIAAGVVVVLGVVCYSIRDLTLLPCPAFPAVFPRFSAALRARNLPLADIALACQHFLAVLTVLLEMRSPLRR